MAEPPYPTVTFILTRTRGTYPTKDGYVAISALLRYTDVFFQLVGADIPSILEDWTENQSITSESYSLVVDWVKSMTTEEAMELFNTHNMPVAPINTFEMLKKEPQFTEREMLFEHSHPEGFFVPCHWKPNKAIRVTV